MLFNLQSSQFQLYAYSLGYVTENQQLIILGGFGLDRKPTDFGCVINIRNNSNDNFIQAQFLGHSQGMNKVFLIKALIKKIN